MKKMTYFIGKNKNNQTYKRIISFLMAGVLFVAGYFTGKSQKEPEIDTPTELTTTQPQPTGQGCTNVKYKVKAGDTLSGIAQYFGVYTSEIMEANELLSPNTIYAGSELTIPNVTEEKANEYYKGLTNDDSNITVKSPVSGVPAGYARGIDISAINGELDWDILEQHYKNGSFSFVIMRMAENWNTVTKRKEFTVDNQFEKNLSECNKREIPYGVYVFSRASNEEQIKTETTSVINYIRNNLNKTKTVDGKELDLTFNLSLPLYMDCFEPDAAAQYSLYTSRQYDVCAKLIKSWCDAIEEAGYFTGVYCNGSFYKTMGVDRLSAWSLWIASYGASAVEDDVADIGLNGKVTFDSIVKNQQVTERGKLDGISCYFDVNVLNKDLFQIVKSFYARRGHVLSLKPRN